MYKVVNYIENFLPKKPLNKLKITNKVNGKSLLPSSLPKLSNKNQVSKQINKYSTKLVNNSKSKLFKFGKVFKHFRKLPSKQIKSAGETKLFINKLKKSQKLLKMLKPLRFLFKYKIIKRVGQKGVKLGALTCSILFVRDILNDLISDMSGCFIEYNNTETNSCKVKELSCKYTTGNLCTETLIVKGQCEESDESKICKNCNCNDYQITGYTCKEHENMVCYPPDLSKALRRAFRNGINTGRRIVSSLVGLVLYIIVSMLMLALLFILTNLKRN